jgi:hypothetical protein
MYQVRFYKGDYRWRQTQANRDECVAYVEHHFNSSANPNSNYTLVITGYNASETSKNWGRWYANRIARDFNVPVAGTNGILVGGYNGRGNGNLKYTHMPAILLEPLFASNPRHAELIRNTEGQDKLAQVLADSIIEFFPDGSLIGFSVGHKYKTSRPKDRGAPVYGGGSEADYAEIVMEKAKYILENYSPIQEEELPAEPEELVGAQIRIIRDGEEMWNYTDLDEDDYVYWDEENRVLYITSTGTSAQLF